MIPITPSVFSFLRFPTAYAMFIPHTILCLQWKIYIYIHAIKTLFSVLGQFRSVAESLHCEKVVLDVDFDHFILIQYFKYTKVKISF